MYQYGTNPNIQDQLRNLLLQSGSTNANQTQAKHVVKVNGRAGAESYFLPPDSDDILLDMNEPIAWFVQTDGAGYKTITPYDISVHKETSQNDILKDLEKRITRLEEASKRGKSNFTTNNAKSNRYEQRDDASGSSDDKG